MVKKIKFEINGIQVEGIQGEKIIDVAKRNGINIPNLCMNNSLERIGACRMCIVDINGRLMTSCTTPISEGIKVKTHSAKVLKSRRINIELLLASHDRDCLTCSENLNCKLQKYAKELGISEIKYEGEIKKYEIDNSSISIKRDNNKCIKCGQCVRICNEIQTVGAIGKQNRGFNTVIAPPLDLTMQQSNCVNCGQCVIHCPTGALSEKSSIQEVENALNSDKIVIAQTAPSIRVALGETFGMKPGIVTGKMVTALKEIGFNKVFDTNLGADITILEEATEFIKRFKSGKNLPMITTCCPAWIKFAEQFFFEQLNHMSTCRSPQAMMSSLIKNYYAKKIGKKAKDIIIVDIMPCTAKKYEIERPEFKNESDYVITTVELGKLLHQYDVDFPNLPNSEFDNPLGESTGAATIFGKTGGVMEAALRTASDWLTGKNLKSLEYKELHGNKYIKETELKIGKETIKIAVVQTLGAARKIMNEIREGKSPYHFIEIMACPGGCINGGGQPRTSDEKTIELRKKAIIKEDRNKKIRKSHKNKSALKLYKEYLGETGSEKAHKLLHTKYFERDFV